MPGEALERLELPLMVTHNTETFRTAYTITVDYSFGMVVFSRIIHQLF
jgi:3,4-dihydroxy-2-butanone 4-phosphate synthase